MKIETYSCDECGKRRDSDANHWFGLSVDPWVSQGSHAKGCILIAPWAQGAGYGRIHVCGQQCAIAAISRFMSTGKLEK